MATLSKPLSLAVFVLLLVAARVEGASPEIAPAQVKKIQTVIRDMMQAQGIPGLSIAVGLENQLCYAEGFGLSDVENKTPTSPETRFRTASIAKPMTAVVVLSLMKDGRLDLDEEVQAYCGGYPNKKWPITSRQLLGHLGGVRHYKSSAEARSTSHYFHLSDAIKTFADDPLVNKPGSKFRYTTFGYNLLGSVAEGASEASFPDLLRERVFDPAGMESTVTDDHFAIIPNRSRGYVRLTEAMAQSLANGHGMKVGQLYNSPMHDTSVKIPGGGLLSTSSDLVRFASAVNANKLLDAKTKQLMWTRQSTDTGEPTKYGLGWQVRSLAGRPLVAHSGGQSGVATYMLLSPETGASVALMCNLQHAKLSAAAEMIAAMFVQPPNAISYAPAIEKLKDAIRYEVEQKKLPAFSMALVDDQRKVWSAGFGHQDADKKVPATSKTVYRVGSVSKLFTDIAVMQLVEQGKLDLDQPVREILPEFQPQNQFDIPLTLRQMMSHRSGLVREPPVGNYFDPTEPTLAATVASLNSTKLIYKPKTKTKYSNAAIGVVGAVLEKKLDNSHPDHVQQTIMRPLGLTSSSFVVNDEIAPSLATGWMRTYDGRRFEAPTFLLGTGPAGNLYSSVDDLAKFIRCLFNGGQGDKGPVLSAKTLQTMTTPFRDSKGRPMDFGLGFAINQLDGHKKIGHGGAVYGFSTQLEVLPDRKLGVAASTSLDGANGVVRRLCAYALRLMVAAQDGAPLPNYYRTRSIPASRAKELVGDYAEVGGDRTAEIIELNGETLIRHGTVQSALRSRVDDGSLVVDDALGYGPTVRFSGRRVRLGTTPYRKRPNKLPPALPEGWTGLIGEYGWDHNVLYILEDHGRLYALIEWIAYYPLTEIDNNTFQFPDFGMYHGERLYFERDATGQATHVTAASIRFDRREVGTKDGETFRIKPVKPVSQLRPVALASKPPKESGQFRDADLVDVTSLDPTIKLDIRYATTNNFMGAVFYKQPRAFMQRPAAEALARANKRLKEEGFGLLVHDAYRPWHVTKMFWDATPGELKDFVANPANGSRHNRGCAVDLTLYDLESGNPVQMVAGYDEFSPRAFPLYPGGTSRQRWMRRLLRQVMEAESFQVYEYEWWHFDFQDWRKYRIGNATFEEIIAEKNASEQNK